MGTKTGVRGLGPDGTTRFRPFGTKEYTGGTKGLWQILTPNGWKTVKKKSDKKSDELRIT